MSTAPDSTPGPAPARKSNTFWWVAGVLVAIVAVLIVGGLLVATYFARNLRIEGSNQQVEIRTPVGDLKVNKSAGTDNTGLPVYPGAASEPSGAAVEFTPSNDEEGVAMATARYRTDDPFEKVGAWYRQRLGPGFRREGPGTVIRMGRVQIGRADMAYISDEHDFARIVALKRAGDAVEIDLLRMGKRQAQ